MTQTKITPETDVVITHIEIAAPPARVFRALVERSQALQWGSGEAFEMTHWEMDARPGGQWEFTSRERTPSGHGKVYQHHGEITAFDPPRLLEYSWFASWHSDPDHRTIVRWDLTPIEGGTHVRVTHSGLAAIRDGAKGYSEGWPGLLLQIKNFIERD